MRFIGSSMNTIQLRLMMLVLLLLCMTLQFIGVYFVRTMEDSFVLNFREQVYSESQLVAEYAKEGVYRSNAIGGETLNKEMSEFLSQLFSVEDTDIHVLDREGRVIASAGHDSAQKIETIQRSLAVQRALNGLLRHERTEKDDQGGYYLRIATPIEREGEVIGVVHVSASMDQMWETIGRIKQFWLPSTLIALALSAVVAFIVSRAVAMPIRQLTERATTMAVGNLKQRVVIMADDEIGRLGEAFNDMSERIEKEVAMREQFVADVSHELRTPLTTLKSTLEVLEQQRLEERKKEQFLTLARTETDRMIRLVQQLLQLARYDGGQHHWKFEPVRWSELIDKACARIAVAMEAQGHFVRFQWKTSQENIPFIRGHEDSLMQVVENVVMNACKYSPSGSTIGLYLSVIQNEVEWVCQDWGSGIPKAEQTRVFDRFYRVDKARSRADGGAGIGLSISQAIVRMHRGTIWITSEEHVGTKVFVRLPLWEEMKSRD